MIQIIDLCQASENAQPVFSNLPHEVDHHHIENLTNIDTERLFRFFDLPSVLTGVTGLQVPIRCYCPGSRGWTQVNKRLEEHFWETISQQAIGASITGGWPDAPS